MRQSILQEKDHKKADQFLLQVLAGFKAGESTAEQVRGCIMQMMAAVDKGDVDSARNVLNAGPASVTQYQS